MQSSDVHGSWKRSLPSRRFPAASIFAVIETDKFCSGSDDSIPEIVGWLT